MTAALRMALVCWSLDPASGLTAQQDAWLAQRLLNPALLTAQERTRLAPGLCAWATATEARLGTLVARLCDTQEAGTPGHTSVLAVLARHPGDETREEATRLANQSRGLFS